MAEHTTNHNGGIRSAVNSTASNAYTYAQRSIDRVVPPSRRKAAYEDIYAYARARPILFAFVATQLAFSFLPFLIFTIFALGTVSFALGVALIFSLFWIGVAFMILVPALLVCFSVGLFVWAWAVGSFLVARALYQRAPVGMTGGMKVEGLGKEVNIVKDENGIDGSFQEK